MISLLLLGIATAMTANQVDTLDKLKNSHYDILIDTRIHSVSKQKDFDLSGCIDKKVGIHGAKDLTADAVQAMKKLGFRDVRDLENLDWAKLKFEGSQLVKGLENDVLTCAKPKSSAQKTTGEPKRCCKEKNIRCLKCWKEFCMKNPESSECSKRTREPKPFSSGEPKRCCKERSPKCFKCWKEFCKKNPKSPECSKRTGETKKHGKGHGKEKEHGDRKEQGKHGKDGKKFDIEALKKLWEQKHGDRKKFDMEGLKKLWEEKEGKEGKKFDEQSMKKLWEEMMEKKEKRGDKKDSADSWDKTNKEDWESKKKDFEKHNKEGRDKKRDWENKKESGKGEKKDEEKRGKDHGKGEKHGKGHSKDGKHGKGEKHGKEGKHGKDHGKKGKHGKDQAKEGKHGKEGERPTTESMQKEQSVNSNVESVEFNAHHGRHNKHHKNGITHSKYFLPAVIGGSVLVAGLLCCLGRYCYNRKKVVSTDVETMGNETGGDTFAPVYQP